MFISSSLLFSSVLKAGWLDEYVTGVEETLVGWESEISEAPLAPMYLLPLHVDNLWTFSFTEQVTENNVVVVKPARNVDMQLGELERLGDLCIRPLIFDEDLLKLYVANYDDQIVFYGFTTKIADAPTAFFTQQGRKLGAHTGLVLADSSSAIEVLELEQNGHFSAQLEGKSLRVDWRIADIDISTLVNNKSYDGDVGGNASSVTPAAAWLIQFKLYLSPCDIEGGCYAGDFEFEFLPQIGLSRVVLEGDNENFGGQYKHEYQLLESPQASFDLHSSQNDYQFEACFAEHEEIRKNNLGSLQPVFNILIVFVVVLALRYRLDFSFRRVLD